MAIKHPTTGQYVKINKDELFNGKGYIPVIIYKNKEERESHPERGIKSVVKIKITADEVDVNKDTIDNLVASMYEKMKTTVISVPKIVYEDKKVYEDYLDC